MRISLHALKQAKQRLRKKWEQETPPGPSLESWLRRLAVDAVVRGKEVAPDRWRYRGIIFVYDRSTYPVTLVTVLSPLPQKSPRYGDGGRRRVILSERAERLLERGAALARGEDPE